MPEDFRFQSVSDTWSDIRKSVSPERRERPETAKTSANGPKNPIKRRKRGAITGIMFNRTGESPFKIMKI